MMEDEQELCRAILELDRLMPHDARIPAETPRPEWCTKFCDVMGWKDGEPCCGMYLDLSTKTFDIMNQVFQ